MSEHRWRARPSLRLPLLCAWCWSRARNARRQSISVTIPTRVPYATIGRQPILHSTSICAASTIAKPGHAHPHVFRHTCLDRCRVHAVGDLAACQRGGWRRHGPPEITVRDHTDQALSRDHRQMPDVLVTPHALGLRQRHRWRGGDHRGVHDEVYLHQPRDVALLCCRHVTDRSR